MHWAGWPLAWPLVLSLRMPSIYGGSAFGQVRLPHHRAMRRHSRAFACVPALPVLPVLPCSQTLSTEWPGIFCTMWQRVRRATYPSRRTLRGSPATSSPSRMHTLSCRACARSRHCRDSRALCPTQVRGRAPAANTFGPQVLLLSDDLRLCAAAHRACVLALRVRCRQRCALQVLALCHAHPRAHYRWQWPARVCYLSSSLFVSLSLCPSPPTPDARADTFNARAQNIARNSYSGCVAHDPPTLVVSCCRRPDGSVKDTCLNALATKEFVVNIMSDWAVEAENHTCANFAPDQVEG